MYIALSRGRVFLPIWKVLCSTQPRDRLSCMNILVVSLIPSKRIPGRCFKLVLSDLYLETDTDSSP